MNKMCDINSVLFISDVFSKTYILYLVILMLFNGNQRATKIKIYSIQISEIPFDYSFSYFLSLSLSFSLSLLL